MGRIETALAVVAGFAGFAVPASAQALVAPVALTNIEGGSSSTIPFGLSGPVRYLCVYDGDQLPFAAPRQVAELRFRADWNNGAATPVKQFLRIDVDVSTSMVRAESASATFDHNHGVDRRRVASFLQVSLPAQPALTGSGPRPCDIALPFQSPWWYGTTPVRQGAVPTSLVVDLHIVSQPSGTYRLDSPFTCDSQITTFSPPGPLCVTSLGQAVEITSSNDIRAAGSVEWTVTHMPPSAPFAVLVWLDATGTWIAFDQNGLPLPQLVPLPAPLHPHAADCLLAVRLDLVQLPGIADTTGLGRLGFTLPADRGIVGRTLYAQALVRDIAANAFGHVTSAGVHSTICGPLGCARIYNIGDAAAVTGGVTFGAASIVEIR